MALLTVEGVYENGTIQLAEEPTGVQRARVVVTFLPAAAAEHSEVARGETVLQRRREAGDRLLARLEPGIDFGGGEFNREELYEEPLDRLGRPDG